MATQLVTTQLTDLGKWGYFTEADARMDDLRVAASMLNCIFDKQGRVASRKGYSNVLSSPISGTPDVEVLHYYRKEIGETDAWIAIGSDKKLYKIVGSVGSATATDITGAITTPSDSDMQFVNYNNKVVGIVQGSNPIIWDGSGNFADMDSGGSGIPDGNCVMSAWGRCFATDADGQVIRWTPTLSEDWDDTGSGVMNVRLVWPDGKDRIVALTAFSNKLVIFGQNNILIYTDGAASTTGAGLNPNSSSFGLVETIKGVGCFARDSVQAVGDDLLFLSDDGLRSLSRQIEYENMPMQTLTRNINDELRDILPTITDSEVKSAYFHVESAYLLKVGGSYYYIDVREPIRDDQGGRVAPILRACPWSGIIWKGIAAGQDRSLRFGFSSGVVGEYGMYLDGTDTYQITLGTTWLSFGNENIKLLKRLIMLAATEKTYQVTFQYAYDFSQNFNTRTVTIEQVSAPAEWNEAEWGEDEWSGDAEGIYDGKSQLSGSGAFIKLAFTLTINEVNFAFYTLFLQLKQGRSYRG